MAATVDLSGFLKQKLQSDFELRQRETSSAGPSLTGVSTNECDNRDDEKQVATSPSHPPYIDMILEAIKALKRRTGSSRQKIEQYILGNFAVKLKVFRKQLTLGLKRGVTKGLLVQVRGCGGSGSFKINKEMTAHRKPLSVKITARAKPPAILERKKPVAPLLSKENIPVSNIGCSARQTRAARKHAQARIRQQLDGTLDKEIEGLLAREERKVRAQKKAKKEERDKDPEYAISDSEESIASAQPSVVEDDDPNDGLCEYERRRLRNIEENRAFMASLNLLGAKEEFSVASKKPRREKKEKEEPVNLEPSRKSLRLQRLDPNGLPLPSPLPKWEESESPVHKRAGLLQMKCINTPERNWEPAFLASIVESLKLKVQDSLNGDIIEEDLIHPTDEPSTPTADDRASLYSQLSFSKAARIFPY